MFSITPSTIQGCFEIVFKRLDDNRGYFTKTFHKIMYKELGVHFEFGEEYFSMSAQNVFRGLHFQIPPKAIDKIIFCAYGAVTDYVADIRKGSPTYGQWASFELNSERPSAVFVPKGLAHGFFTRSEKALMQCKSSDVFDTGCDKAVSYKSFSLKEQIPNPILSEKDITAPLLQHFDSPFSF